MCQFRVVTEQVGDGTKNVPCLQVMSEKAPRNVRPWERGLGQGYLKCVWTKKCDTNRCQCLKNVALCNDRCHNSSTRFKRYDLNIEMQWESENRKIGKVKINKARLSSCRRRSWIKTCWRCRRGGACTPYFLKFCLQSPTSAQAYVLKALYVCLPEEFLRRLSLLLLDRDLVLFNTAMWGSTCPCLHSALGLIVQWRQVWGWQHPDLPRPEVS